MDTTTASTELPPDLAPETSGELRTHRARGASAVTLTPLPPADHDVADARLGQRGAFTLQHTGVMARGAPSLVVTVVPDSGTDALAGLRGAMTMQIEGGQHRDVFDSTLWSRPLPAAPPVGASSPTAA